MSDPTTRAVLNASAAHIRPETFTKAERIRANRAAARPLADDPMLTAEEAAAEAGVALSTWWKHVKSGRFPAPTYPLPRCPRWRRSDVRAALEMPRAA